MRGGPPRDFPPPRWVSRRGLTVFRPLFRVRRRSGSGGRPVGVTQDRIVLVVTVVRLPDDLVVPGRISVDGHRVRMIGRDDDERVLRTCRLVGRVHGPGEGDRFGQRQVRLRFRQFYFYRARSLHSGCTQSTPEPRAAAFILERKTIEVNLILFLLVVANRESRLK